MQSKSEALNAARETIESVISTPQFIASPANAVIDPCAGPNTRCTDVTGDGTPEYVTTLVPQPVCMSAKPIKNVRSTWRISTTSAAPLLSSSSSASRSRHRQFAVRQLVWEDARRRHKG